MGANRISMEGTTAMTSKSDVMAGYTRATWPALCAEVAKLNFTTTEGDE